MAKVVGDAIVNNRVTRWNPSISGTRNQSHNEAKHVINLSVRPIGSCRQESKNPHTADVKAISTSNDFCEQNYYEKYKLPQNWDYGKRLENDSSDHTATMSNNQQDLFEAQRYEQKYSSNIIYYADSEVTIKNHIINICEYVKSFCQWKYFRWPIILLFSIVLIFGLIMYCIWLHNVSVAREMYFLGRQRISNVTGQSEQTSERMTSLTDTYYIMGQSINTTSDLSNSNIIKQLTTLAPFDYENSPDWKKRAKDENIYAEKTIATEETILIPANVLQFTAKGSFTSSKDLKSTTATNFAKISPTIPPFIPLKPTSEMSVTRQWVVSQESGCFSTSLPMCQGVLHYDLTYNSTISLNETEKDAYQALIDSNCSTRAIEFLCALLEPECRPAHIGILLPCRRICKAILEACSIIISNSDILSAIFDCGIYRNSNDPNMCEDPTRRRDYCYNNEFECADRSCIPDQWQCDNIKDCASGDDEEKCLVCDQPDEFRCRSNDKCVPQSVRCNLKNDCSDGSDEYDCDEHGSREAHDVFTHNSADNVYTYVAEYKTQTNNFTNVDEYAKIVPNSGSKGFVNFRDSKEIMITSDSENKYATARLNSTDNTYPAITTTLKQSTPTQRVTQTEGSPVTCELHQLRCVSGKCITVDQICDKRIDCPDGADELMCVYKEGARTTRYNNTLSTTYKASQQTLRSGRKSKTTP